jgi:RNA polymerase sigma-70 factor, ECF subfamily
MEVLTELPDERLVEDALQGKLDSFMELCRRHYPALVAVARGVLADRHLAEDAAQEALARACRRLPSLADRARFASWVSAICRNSALDMVRKAPRWQSLEERDVPEPAAEPDDRIEVIREAISHLPPEAREVIYLRYDVELSYEEIADALDLTVQAVNGRLRRAKAAIRAWLADKAGMET